MSVISTRLATRHYEVIEFTRSEEALQYLDRHSIDLILLSTAMERINGKFLIEKIREKSQMVTIPIIMMAKEDEMAELVMLQEREFDDFLIKPFSAFVLQLRVSLNIARNRVRIEANALTHLPGNIPIEQMILKKIENNEKFSVLYIDVNHFKSFNDHYGFEKGDEVILQTAKILLQTREKVMGEDDCFVGHVGGDDFVVILSPDYEEAFARAFIEEFDRIIPTYYNGEDQKCGFIRVTNRRGKLETFPLMSCSVAACNNLIRNYKSLGEIAQDAAEVKSFLKSQPGSHYLRDRRSEPIRKLEDAVLILAPEVDIKKRSEGDEPLGQLLLDEKLINQEQLEQALKHHMDSGERLGQAFITLGFVKDEDIGRILSRKLKVPYANLRKMIPSREMLHLFSLDLMKSHRIFPFEFGEKGIKVAMCNPADVRAIEAIEQISGMKVIPYLTLENELEEWIHLFSDEALNEERIG